MQKKHHYSSRPASRIVRSESSARRVVDQAQMRLLCVIMFFGLSFAALGIRLFEVSTVGGGDLPFKRLVSEPALLLKYGEKQVNNAENAAPKSRGEIVDRNGVLLATNINTASLVANPKLIRNKENVIHQLRRIFPEFSRASLQKKLSEDSRFVYIKRHLNPREQHQTNALGIPGLFFEPDQKRIYPYGELIAHIVGYVGVDNQGLSGIERAYDKKLANTNIVDSDLSLSIDLRVQSVLHNQLKNTMQTFSAIGAAGVISDIYTGEIIAMVSLPGFNPNMPSSADDSAKFNRATLGLYEMGSVFKTFTMAMAFHHDIVSFNDGYDVSNPIRVAGYTINDYHPIPGWRNIREIFAQSSNIGTVKVAMDVGAKRQRSFLKSLGMMEQMTLNIPERATPIVPSKWRQLNAMTISYGHGISVTPLHVVQAMSTVSGDGIKRPLTLQKNTSSSSAKGERVIAESTSLKIRKILRDVVQYGTASKAKARGYRVGGKTGTAEKIVNGRYKDNAKITSFASVFPTDNPRYSMLIMIDEPKGIKQTHGFATGGWVAAPVSARVIERVAPMLGIRPVFEVHNAANIPAWVQKKKRNALITKRPFYWQEEGVHAASF